MVSGRLRWWVLMMYLRVCCGTEGRLIAGRVNADGGTKSPLNLVGLAAAGADGTNKGRLTVDGEVRIANHLFSRQLLTCIGHSLQSSLWGRGNPYFESAQQSRHSTLFTQDQNQDENVGQV